MRRRPGQELLTEFVAAALSCLNPAFAPKSTQRESHFTIINELYQ
jgi:hypothetical protein